MNAPATFGHNEAAVRLGLLAEDARVALRRVSNGEDDAIAGWLAYGAALNEGRALFHPQDDKGFGQWVAELHRQVVGVEPNDHERAAAMWAAAYPEQFEAARAAGNARTVRGVHAKWQELDAERKAAEERAKAAEERAKAEAARRAEDEARRIAESERREAEDRAEAERAADEAARNAANEAARKEARERAAAEAARRAEAERRATEAEGQAKAADRAAKMADKAARDRDKKAKAAEKRAAKAKAGVNTNGNSAHVANNSGDNEWYTPPAYLEAARAVLGGFDLDPATSEIANQFVMAATIFTAENSGLSQDWPVGRIWMNPPYAQPLMGQFASKFAAAIRDGSSGIVLVNNATETAWFQEIAAECSAICFPRSRVKFLDPAGNPSGSPLQGQAVIYCGENPEGFEAAFSGFGLVVRHG